MIAVIVYHKNLESIYPAEWIERFKVSILEQSMKDFQIFELNYGGGKERIFEDSIYESYHCHNFVEAMNMLIAKILFDSLEEYEFIFNTNVDDWYSVDRIEKQLELLNQGHDIVSSNFILVDNDGTPFHRHEFDKLDISKELSKDHNIICHPVVAYRSSFFNAFSYRQNEIPTEDLQLWKRAINKTSFIISPEVLCYHRVHNNSVCKSTNR